MKPSRGLNVALLRANLRAGFTRDVHAFGGRPTTAR